MRLAWCLPSQVDMSSERHDRTLIVGQGLAGTLLAWQLIRLGQRVMVVDREEDLNSSKVAGGIVTPITGMRMVKTWRLDEFYPAAKEFYRWIENESGQTFYVEIPIQRLFKSADEQVEFDRRMKEPGFGEYVLKKGVPDKSGLSAEAGGFLMQGAYLEMVRFLQVSRLQLIERQSYQVGDVNPASLAINPSGIQWNGIGFDQVVFCEGWTGRGNPFFDWVPFKPTKGEVLEIRCDGLGGHRIINRGGFIAPLGNQNFRAGSTYEWDQLDSLPTEAAKSEICKKIRGMTDLPFEVIGHKAGVRPVIHESKALLGRHPSEQRLAYFNGLGFKGVLNGPFLSAMLARHLVEGSPVEEEVDVRKNI